LNAKFESGKVKLEGKAQKAEGAVTRLGGNSKWTARRVDYALGRRSEIGLWVVFHWRRWVVRSLVQRNKRNKNKEKVPALSKTPRVISIRGSKAAK
jgi:hypothetical protein